jgi:hypothetical protein
MTYSVLLKRRGGGLGEHVWEGDEGEVEKVEKEVRNWCSR